MELWTFIRFNSEWGRFYRSLVTSIANVVLFYLLLLVCVFIRPYSTIHCPTPHQYSEVAFTQEASNFCERDYGLFDNVRCAANPNDTFSCNELLICVISESIIVRTEIDSCAKLFPNESTLF